MANTGTGVHVVVAKGSANQLLHQVDLFIGAARRGNTAHSIFAVFGLNAFELAGRITDGLIPTHLLPSVADALANHRLGNAVFVLGITPSKPDRKSVV